MSPLRRVTEPLRRWPRRTAQKRVQKLVGPVGHELSRAVSGSRRHIATTPVVAAAVLALAVLPGLGARDAVHASSSPVVIDARAAGPWLADLRSVAAAWNDIGLGTRIRIAEPDPARSTVGIQLGHVAATCGPDAAGCVVTRGARKLLVLGRRRDATGAGAGPATLVAHELGHLLGLGHRSSGCTVMRTQPSSRGCDQLRFTRTVPSARCPSRTLRSWRCRTREQHLELCGPTAEDAPLAIRRAGLSPRATVPRLCVAHELSGPSPRSARHARNAGLRVIVAREGDALLRAARNHDPQTRRWCARAVELPAAARKLCAVARG